GVFSPCENRPPPHARFAPQSKRLANVAASAHAAVGDDRHIPRRFFKVSITCCCAVDRGRHLRNPESEHTPRSASGSGPHTNPDRSRSAFHYLKSHFVSDCVTHDHRDAHLPAKFFKIERLVLRCTVADW